MSAVNGVHFETEGKTWQQVADHVAEVLKSSQMPDGRRAELALNIGEFRGYLAGALEVLDTQIENRGLGLLSQIMTRKLAENGIDAEVTMGTNKDFPDLGAYSFHCKEKSNPS